MSDGKAKKIKQPVKNGVAKVPVIMQMEALECGAACLDMVLAYYEKWIPLEQVRLDCGVSRDGSNAGNILKAARNYGLEAAGYKLEPEELKKYGQFPAIVHWNFNHFIVVCGFKGDKVYVNDPAQGSVTMDMETFDEGFTGVALMFEPGEAFEPGGEKRKISGFIKEKLSGNGAAVIFVILTTIIASVLDIYSSAFSRVFMDKILTKVDENWIFPFFSGLFAISIVEIVLAWIQSVYTLRTSAKMDVTGSSSFMWKIMKLPIEFFSQRMTGDIQMRKDTNASLADTIVNTVAPLGLDVIMMFVYLYVMVRYNAFLAAIGVGSIALNLFLAKFITDKRVNITRVQMRDVGKLSSMTVSGIEMIETIKSSGAENGYFEKWSGLQASVNSQSVKFSKLNQLVGMIPSLITELSNLLVQILGVYLVIQGQFTLGMVFQFQALLNHFTAPATSLIQTGQRIQEMTTDMERVDDVMEYPDDVNYNDTPVDMNASYSKLSGSVELKNVTFGYARLADPLLKDFTMTVKPGSSVAFVGASGCGKSTITKLISGLYNPWSGDILFDGKHINEIDRTVFRGSLAVVDQEIILFEDTIANNIKMWDTSIQDFEMVLAARDAQIHEDIMKRDGGYDYKLIEGGRDFSGGQRQRIEIARVLAQDPTIIILDEATSALDAKTEYEVVKSIRDRGITSIVVAHRLSTIRDCDEIIVLDNGLVAERGTHDELYAKGGLYTQLVTDE